MGRRFIASVLVFLLAGIPLPAHVDVMGVVTQCSGANLGTGSASTGASIYAGDSFSTDATGFLRLHSHSANFLLAEQSAMTLRGLPAAAEADLMAGTLTFSAALASAIAVYVNQASVRPAADAPTIAQIKILGPKELLVSAQRGALQFTYNDESETIPEGASYKVVLDPPDNDDRYPSYRGYPPKKSGRRHKGFFFIIFGVVGGVTAWGVRQAMESPDRP